MSTDHRFDVWAPHARKVTVRIEGNADERGTREYNFSLGARRGYTEVDIRDYYRLKPQAAREALDDLVAAGVDEVLVARYIDEAYGGHGTTRLLGLRSGAGTQEPS